MTRARFSLSVLFLLSLACGGCGTLPAPSTDGDPATRFRATGGAQGVTVLGAGDEAAARPVADRHCAAHGKAARFLSIRDSHAGRHAILRDVAFACVSPASPDTTS